MSDSGLPSGGQDGFAEPPPGAERVILNLDAFELHAGAEAFKCQNVHNPLGRDVAILQSQSLMSTGSHHLAVFRVTDNGDAPMEDCGGLEFHAIVHAAQTPVAKTIYPSGVGAFLPGSNGFRLNAHYLNITNETIHASVQIALDYVDVSAVTHLAARIYMNDGTLSVPPGTGTAGGTLTIPAEVGDIQLLQVQGHMHRRGVHFAATLPDGSPLYETDSWNEPQTEVYDPALTLTAGSAVTWQCDIENETDQTITFGESADTNEMCALTGDYYPAPDGKMLVGDVALGTMSLME